MSGEIIDLRAWRNRRQETVLVEALETAYSGDEPEAALMARYRNRVAEYQAWRARTGTDARPQNYDYSL